jgi:hypothetical protein
MEGGRGGAACLPGRGAATARRWAGAAYGEIENREFDIRRIEMISFSISSLSEIGWKCFIFDEF